MALVIALDVATVLVASLGGRLAFVTLSGHGAALDTTVGLGLVAAMLQIGVGHSLGLYEFPALLVPNLRRVAVTCLIVLLLLTANLFVLKAGADVSRGFLLAFGSLLLAVTLATRLALSPLLARCVSARKISGRPAVVIGTAEELHRLPSRDLFRLFGLSEVGRVTVPDVRGDGLGRTAAEAVRLARTLAAEDLVVALPWSDEGRLTALEQGLRLSPLPVRLLPDASARKLMARHGPRRGLKPVDLQRAPVGQVGQVAKRVLDVAIAAVALVLLLPLFGCAALAIRLDTAGPVLFRQRRNGFDQRTFTIFKFRTMTVLEDQDAVVQARRNDDRVTRVGRVLRRTSMDELPQLVNVLRGEMAIVGPRPHALAHDRLYGEAIDDYCVRHHVKPGITGWAQVNGLRGETRDAEQMQRRVEYDLWYIDNWSLVLDLRILLRTCREVLAHDAY